MSTYNPPAFTDAGGSITNGYTPPAFTDVGGDLQIPDGTIVGIGWLSLAFGAASVVNVLETLSPAGVSAGAIGTTTARLDADRVSPSGATHSAFGTAALQNDLEALWPTGFYAGALGSVEIRNDLRWLSPAALLAPMLDEPDVTHWLQHARPEALIAGSIGTPSIGESPRDVRPPWFYATSFGRAFVGEYLTIGPLDGLAGQWGTATVASNLQRVYGYAVAAGAVGTHEVISSLRELKPLGYAQTLFGTAEMVPLLRTLLHSYGVTAEDRGIGTPYMRMMTVWSEGLVAGVAADRVDVTRSGHVINPAGLAAGAVGAGTTATYWERTLAAEPFESFYSSTWHHALNNGRLLRPVGLSTLTMTQPIVFNELRFVQQIFPDAGATGDPWVSRAVRSVAIIEGPPQPLWPAPLAQNWERFIAPDGYWTPTTGTLYLEHRQNRIIPDRVLPHTSYGTASLVNEDRELRIGGLDAGPRGLPRVSRDPEYLTLAGETHSLFALAMVRDSRQTVRTSFAGAGGFVPETHWIRNELPDPPVTQFLEAASVGTTTAVGGVSVRTNYVYPYGIASAEFGTANVVANGIWPIGIPSPGYGEGGPVGIPTMPGTQFVTTSDEHDFGRIGDIRLTPHWIFGPLGIGRGQGELIDTRIFGFDPTRPRFGSTLVTHEHRAMTGVGTLMSLYGFDTAVTNQQRTLPLLGWRAFRSGFPIVNSKTDVDCDGNGLDATLFGDTIVAPPPYTGDQTLIVQGMAGAFGNQEVQNQHRQLDLSGLVATRIGTQWASYQYDPFPMTAIYSTQWGEMLVQYLHRTFDGFGGTDMLDMTPFPGWSGDRMRVRSRTFLSPVGSVHTASGTATVTHIDRVWGVNGIERPQFQVPEGAQVRGVSRIDPSGVSAGTIGTPSKWQAGDDVQPYGEAMGGMGSTLLSFVVGGSGLDALLTGDIAITLPVEPTGRDAAEFGLATAAHDGGNRICNSQYALAMALAAFDAGGIGSHEVAHD
jgi:hypothetical protein